MATVKKPVSKELVTKPAPESTQMVLMSDEVPEYLRGGTGRGNEGVTADDMIVPRLEIVQSLSPARDRSSAEFIPGAEEGKLYNSITRRLYGDDVMVVPVLYRHMYAVWVYVEKGSNKGGFRGSFATKDEAVQRVERGEAEKENLEIVDAHEHFVLLLSPNGIEEAAVSMSRSKSRVSKRWNSLIRIAGGDRFSRAYKVAAVPEQNAKGEKFYNFRIEAAGFPSREVYERATALYDSIKTQGRSVHADATEDLSEGTSTRSGDSEY